MPRAGFEPAFPASEWPQTYALDHATTGIGELFFLETKTNKNDYIVN